MVFIQEYGIEYRAYDITSQPWFLSTDSLNRSPLHIPCNIWRNREFTIGREITIYFQQSFFFRLNDIVGAYINELLHEGRQHSLFLPLFKSLPRRTLIEIKVLEI